MSQASFLIVRMPHWIKRKRGGDGEGRKWEGGLWLIFFKGVCDQWTRPAFGWGGALRWRGEGGSLMLTAGDFCAWHVIDVHGRWGEEGVHCVQWGRARPCLWVVVLIMWQLGRLIVDKQQDYEGLYGGERAVWWGRPLICQAQRKLVRADWRSLFECCFRILKPNGWRRLKLVTRKVLTCSKAVATSHHLTHTSVVIINGRMPKVMMIKCTPND